MTNEKESFEVSIKRLEQIVNDLERGELTLEDALSRYEEGIAKLRHCHVLLEQVEKKIVLLSKNPDGSIQEQPFEEKSNPNR